MSTAAKLFMTGLSPAERLPKSLRFEGAEVVAKRFGNDVLLLPADAPWELLRSGGCGYALKSEGPSGPRTTTNPMRQH